MMNNTVSTETLWKWYREKESLCNDQEAQLSHLQKLCEEQKAELEEIKSLHALQRTRYGVAEKWWRSRNPRERELQSPDLGQLLDELMGALVLAQNDALESRTLESQLATQTERVRVLTGALEDFDTYYHEEITNLEFACASGIRIDPDQLAHYRQRLKVARQALKQESLGDGK